MQGQRSGSKDLIIGVATLRVKLFIRPFRVNQAIELETEFMSFRIRQTPTLDCIGAASKWTACIPCYLETVMFT